jgi:hypothetical protein
MHMPERLDLSEPAFPRDDRPRRQPHGRRQLDRTWGRMLTPFRQHFDLGPTSTEPSHQRAGLCSKSVEDHDRRPVQKEGSR